MTAPIVVSQTQAALALGVSTRTLRRWTRDGTIPSISLGGLLRYRTADLEAFVAAAADNRA